MSHYIHFYSSSFVLADGAEHVGCRLAGYAMEKHKFLYTEFWPFFLLQFLLFFFFFFSSFFARLFLSIRSHFGSNGLRCTYLISNEKYIFMIYCCEWCGKMLGIGGPMVYQPAPPKYYIKVGLLLSIMLFLSLGFVSIFSG